MIAGVLAGMTWALETIMIGIALSMSQFSSTDEAILLAPFVGTFMHDSFSAIWACMYNSMRGNLKKVFSAIKTKNGKFVVLAAIIGGPMGMTGYILAINNMGASIGAVASAIFPAIGSVLAYIFLKEKMQWYRWGLLLITLLGVYGLSYSPEVNINNFLLGILGAVLCAFGWGIEAVILAKCMKESDVTDEVALQIRQTTSAFVYGVVLLNVMNAWPFTINLFNDSGLLIPTIALAGLCATISYLFYYKAISQIGASKAMALNVSYAAWAIVFSVIIFRDISILNVNTIICSIVVLVCSILVAADYKELFTI